MTVNQPHKLQVGKQQENSQSISAIFYMTTTGRQPEPSEDNLYTQTDKKWERKIYERTGEH